MNQFEWDRFLKNSFFNVGGYELSLYEINNCILTDALYSINNYRQDISFKSTDTRVELKLTNPDPFIPFAMFIPTR